MATPADLLAECKQLITHAEKHASAVLEHLDPAHLNQVAHRLRLFIEHVEQVRADEPVRHARAQALERGEEFDPANLQPSRQPASEPESGTEEPAPETQNDGPSSEQDGGAPAKTSRKRRETE